MNAHSGGWKVFASYSSEDVRLVGPIANILRAAFSDPTPVVFFSRDSIPVGEERPKMLMGAIGLSQKAFVFWSEHAKNSKWVKIEYQTALQLGRPTIPVLLDRTPLPESLAGIQGVDLCSLTSQGHSQLLRRAAGGDSMETGLRGGFIVGAFRGHFEAS